MMTFKEYLIEDNMKCLIKNKMPLSKEERKKVKDAGAEWSDNRSGVWKSKDKKGKIVFGSNTHRAGIIKPTLKGAIKAFEFIKTTA